MSPRTTDIALSPFRIEEFTILKRDFIKRISHRLLFLVFIKNLKKAQLRAKEYDLQ